MKKETDLFSADKAMKPLTEAGHYRRKCVFVRTDRSRGKKRFHEESAFPGSRGDDQRRRGQGVKRRQGEGNTWDTVLRFGFDVRGFGRFHGRLR
jgi:hypothetical protein